MDSAGAGSGGPGMVKTNQVWLAPSDESGRIRKERLMTVFKNLRIMIRDCMVLQFSWRVSNFHDKISKRISSLYLFLIWKWKYSFK